MSYIMHLLQLNRELLVKIQINIKRKENDYEQNACAPKAPRSYQGTKNRKVI